MNYNPHQFNPGDVLYAADLNQIDQQIAENQMAILLKQDKLTAGNGINIQNSTISTDGDMFYKIVGEGTVAGSWSGTDQRITEYSDGLTILYKVPVAGASTTKLNINNLGQKTCYLNGSTKITTNYAVGAWVLLKYCSDINSGCWQVFDYNSDANTVPSAYCSTAAATAAKTATFNGYAFNGTNHFFPIVFTVTNTAASKITLNINGQGAKDVYLNGQITSSTNYNVLKGSYIAYYDMATAAYYINSDGTIPNVQTKLVSGTNIKTINNEPILGSGNITVSGGGGGITDVKKNNQSLVTDGVAVIPNNVSAYNNDAGYVASNGLKTINNESIAGSGNIGVVTDVKKFGYSVVTNGVATIPNSLSSYNNDVGYLTPSAFRLEGTTLYITMNEEEDA